MAGNNASFEMDTTAENVMREMASTTGQNSQHPASEANKYRKELNDLVVQIFAKDGVPGLEKLIKCLNHLMEEFPQIFISVPTSYGEDEMECNPQTKKRPISNEFTTWVLSRLFHLLSFLQDESIKPSCVQLGVNLFHAVILRDTSFFGQLVGQLLQLAKDLVIADEALCSEEPTAELDKTIIRCFVPVLEVNKEDAKSDDKLDLTHLPIVLCDRRSCEVLQIAVTQMLHKMTSSISHHLSSREEILIWGILCCQLECGDLELKQASLESLTELIITDCDLPSDMATQDYFMNCLSSMFGFITSGNAKSLGETVCLEASLADCIAVVFEAVDGVKCSQRINAVAEEEFVDDMFQSLSQYGMAAISSIKLKEAVGHVVTYTFGKNGRYNLHQDRLSSSARNFLLKELAFQGYAKWIINSLFALVSYEMNLAMAKAESVSPERAAQTESSSEDDHAENRANSRKKACYSLGLPTYPRVTGGSSLQLSHLEPSTLSVTWAEVHNKFQQMVRNIHDALEANDVPPQLSLDIVRSVFELGILCSIWLKPPVLDPPKTETQYTLDKPSTKTCYEWFTSSLASQILNNVLRTLEVSASMYGAIDSSLFSSLLGMVGAVLCAQDVRLASSELWPIAMAIASLPWIDSKSLIEEPDDEAMKKIKIIARSATIDEDPGIVECSIRLLACLPHSISPNWRIEVFRKALLSSDCGIQKAALKAFPILIHQLKNYRDMLVAVLSHPKLCEDSNTEVQVAVCGILGTVSCVLADKSFLTNDTYGNMKSNMTELLLVCCSTCSAEKNNAVRDMEATRPSVVDPSIILPFLKLVSSKNKEVKLRLISSLKSMFCHIPIHSSVLSTCLCLIDDSDYDVRHEFSWVFGFCLTNTNEVTSQIEQLIFSRLKRSLMEADTKNNIRWHETLLQTTGQLGKVAQGNMLLQVIVRLMENLLSRFPLISATAYMQLKEIGEAKQMSMTSLFLKFKKPVCKFLVEAMHSIQSQENSDALTILYETVQVFEFGDLTSFLSMTLKYILPHLISKATPEASAILRLLAKYQVQSSNRREMIVNHFKYILAHLVCFCSTAETEKALSYSQNETSIPISSLFRCDYQGVHNELLMNMSTHYDQVFKGLAMLAATDDDYTGQKNITTPEELADFLRPRLLGFLVFFDSKFLNSNIALEEKKQALHSLIEIMKLMGPRHITSVRMKVMATLRIALRFQEDGFPELCCRGWNTFVRSVELASLGQMLTQIVVTLLPLLQLIPKNVAEIFHFLIVENRETMRDYFHEIHLIPDIPELCEISAVLREHNEKPSSQEDFRTVVIHSLKTVTHENLDVRLHALTKLKHLLHTNKVAMHNFVLGNELVDPLIPQLVTTIMLGCRESNPKARILIGECLGELGAIDPGRLEVKFGNPLDDLSKFHSSIEEENFAHDLILEVVRAFLAAEDTRIQDCSSYAIQELLQIYECRNINGDTKVGTKLWNRFPQHVQEILYPLVQSRYIMNLTSNWKNTPSPIYRSSKGSTYKEWVCCWTGYLITKVKQEKPAKVFLACSMIIKHDVNTALFLLPYILLHALLDGSDEEKNEICKEIMSVLSLHELPDSKRGTHSDLRHMSTQTVFSVLDYLVKWVRKKTQLARFHSPKRRNTSSSSAESSAKSQVSPTFGPTTIREFLERIPQIVLANESYHCRSYTRALMHLENHIKNNRAQLKTHLGFLQKLYVALEEPDGVAGVAAIRHEEPLLSEQILVHESTGQLQDAFACYERAIHVEPDELCHYQGLLKCLMGLDQPSTALNYVSGVLSLRPNWSHALNQYRVEAAWKLGNWERLETFLKSNDTQAPNPGVGVGRILLALRNKDEEDYCRLLEIVRGAEMGPLLAASMENGAYQRGYLHLVRLHMLNELENGLQTLLNFPPKSKASEDEAAISPVDLLKDWESRIKSVQFSLTSLEPILSLRRVILGLAKESMPHLTVRFDHHIANCWLQSAKVARKSGHQQRAYSSLLEASSSPLAEVFLEKAKWHWNKSEPEQAILSLQKGLQEHYPDMITLKKNSPLINKDERLACAKAKLLLARYVEESANLDSTAIIKMYREVQDIYQDWEDGHYYLALHYDRILATMSDNKEKKLDVTYQVIKLYGQSLCYGCHNIYHSMPRMLSLWLELGTQAVELRKGRQSSTSFEHCNKALLTVSKTIAVFLEKIPPYQFYTAFSQLVSRICHSNKDVFKYLKDIIGQILAKYPQQAMWMMISVSKSSYKVREARCKEIFERAKELNNKMLKFLQDATMLVDLLLDLCNRTVTPGIVTLSINTHFSAIPRLLDERNFSQIMLPLQSFMSVTLPSISGSNQNHNPFPHHIVYFQSFEDVVEVMASLQKPKKVTIRGSDGKLYSMMCKPKDDLRKDCRLMEFNALVNKSLMRNAETRRRQLVIRTYAVIPLNEECGILEWVPNLVGLRHLLNNIYKEKNMITSGKDLKSMSVATTASLEHKLNVFKNKLLPRFPPVMDEWFLQSFPDSTAWYMARLAFARTTAVMSMVGYIVGLGDRHGENMLLDSSCGDMVHVDFNCLFNRGETFDYPERVPFRLTHNMVAAMGPTGYEGIYRKSCEATLRVMRNQTDTLMSVLKPFVHDPLVEWGKVPRGTRGNPADSGEINNEKAMTHVRDIEQRLKGILKNKTKSIGGLPLSIEGQVNYLIQEATDERNLCQMFLGWAPYM